MARGTKLTVSEKYAIKGMVEDGMEAKDIAKHLCRTAPFIQRYLDAEHAEIKEKVRAADEHKFLPVSVEKELVAKLRRDGMTMRDVSSAIKRLKMAMDGPNHNIEQLATWCKEHPSVLNIMGTKTDSKKSGVAVMNEAASARGEAGMGRDRRTVRDTAAHIFKPFGDRDR